MSAYLIKYFEETLEDLNGIPINIKKRIKQAIEARLTTAPNLYGERLRRDLAGLWKIRVGDFRVVYEFNEKERTVSIWAIRHRSNVYHEALRRWLRRS